MNDNVHKMPPVPPFVKFVAAAVPMVFDDSLSYYEALCALWKYISGMTDVINNNATLEEEYIAKFDELKEFVDHYFDNLDVQEEINNKLDEMAEDGQLADIISQYLNSTAIFGYDTVADMKNAANLVNGSYARTLGYYAKNDGGGALYKIRTITNDDVIDEGSIIEMNDVGNTLIAELITSIVYPEMFGAYGDGTHNDTTAFTNAIAYTSKLTLTKDKTYKITNLVLSKDLTLDGNGSTLIDDTAVDKFIECSTLDGDIKHITFNNVVLNVPNSNYGIYIHSNRFYGNNVKIYNPVTACFACYKGSTSGRYGNFIIDDITCDTSATGVYIDCTDSNLSNFHGHNLMTHIDVRRGLTHISHAHGWNFNTDSTDWVTGSVFMNIQGDVVMNDVYSDTLENTFVLEDNGTTYRSIDGTNISFFINTSSYPATQNAPVFLKNLSTFKGNLSLTNIYANANNWKDSSNNTPYFINETFNTSKVNIDNVTLFGYGVGSYVPYVIKGDIQTSELNYNLTTYITAGTRKRWEYKYAKKIDIRATLKTSLPDNTLIWDVNFVSGSRFASVDEEYKFVIAKAQFISTSTEGLCYDLDVEMHNGRITVYNHTGLTLNNGLVIISILSDDITA